jgi:hypothetical protein
MAQKDKQLPITRNQELLRINGLVRRLRNGTGSLFFCRAEHPCTVVGAYRSGCKSTWQRTKLPALLVNSR